MGVDPVQNILSAKVSHGQEERCQNGEFEGHTQNHLQSLGYARITGTLGLCLLNCPEGHLLCCIGSY